MSQFKNSRQRKAVMAKLSKGFYRKKAGISSPQPFGKTSKKDFHLPVRFSIYVPSTQDLNRKITRSERQKRVQNTQKFLSKTFGGSTKTNAEGTFVSEKNGELVKEQVFPVTSYANKESYNKSREKLRRFIEKKKKDWGQEGIGFEFEDDFYSV